MSIGPHRMSLTDLTFMAFNLNTIIDSQRYNMVPIMDVRRAVQDRTIFAYLKTKLGSDIDLSILDADPAAKAELATEWQHMEAILNSQRKFDAEHCGLQLLFAFLIEGIQRRTQEV